MNKLKDLILLNYKRYPALQLEDYFKLIYQNEFGPGHLISDLEHYVEFLTEEKEIKHENRYIEEIGNDILRVDVSCIDSPLAFGRYAQIAASKNKGTKANFLKKMEQTRKIILDEQIPISIKNYDEILDEYVKAGFAPASHSDFYKKEYNPHYRIITKKYWNKYLKIIKVKK